MKEENESEIFCQYFPNLPNNKNVGGGGGVGVGLKIAADHIPNLLTQNFQVRSLHLSDSQPKF